MENPQFNILRFGAFEYKAQKDGKVKSNERLMENGVIVQGVYSRTDGRNTWFQYEAEGKVWEKRSMVASPTIRAGGEVTVAYPEGRPDQGRMTSWESWGIFLIVGGVFGVMGIGFLIAVLPGIFLKRSLEANGMSVTARVTEIVVVRWIRINRVNPYVVHAVCVHPYTGQEMKVKSELFMEDLGKYIRNNQEKGSVNFHSKENGKLLEGFEYRS